MYVNVYDKIAQWLLDCPEIGGYSYFNVIPFEAGSSSVNSNSGSTILNEYIDGSKEVRLLFTINIVCEYDNGGTSNLNLISIAEFDKIIDFVETHNNNNEYPDLGDGFIVNKIGATYKAPEVYVTQENPNIARYEGQFYIEYLEKE